MTFKIISLIIPGLIAILGNIAFYIIVKSRIDKSIERYKIAYAGIYKEKIEIHRGILDRMYKLKLKNIQYKNSGDRQHAVELFADFNNFINYYLTNQPFIKESILGHIQKYTEELQSCFDNFFSHFALIGQGGLDPNEDAERIKQFFESASKINANKPFKEIEDLIVTEMRADLKTDESS